MRSADRIDALVIAAVLLLGIVASLRHGSALGTVLVALALGSLSIAASIDRRSLRLPNVLTLPALGLGLVAGAVVGTFGGAVVGAASVAAPFLVVHLVDPAGMGFGDVKCAAAAGAVAGAVLPTLGPLLAVVVVLVLVVGARLVGGSDAPRALGPTIVLGVALSLVPAAVLAPEQPPAPCCTHPVEPQP